MNAYLAAAGALTLCIGLGHSVLGEVLIFRRLRSGSIFRMNGGNVLGQGHVRILWATWHVVTVLGCLIGSGLVWLSLQPMQASVSATVLPAIAAAMLISSTLVLLATRGRHPGWVGLLAVAALAVLGRTP